MAVPQQSTTTTTESAATINSANTALFVDMVSLFSSFLQATVARQVMVVGDPTNPNAVEAVTNTVATGAEYGALFRLSPGSPELQLVVQELRMLRAEIQNQITISGAGLPITPPALIDSLGSQFNPN